MAEGFSPALREMSDAVLAVASNLEIEQVLQRLVDVSRGLVHARYAALGIPNGEGGFAQFLTSGMSEELIERLGPLPETHGLLGAMLEGFDSYRTGDIQARPALPRLVAARPSRHALVPRRADLRGRRGDRRLLPHRQGGAPTSSRRPTRS